MGMCDDFYEPLLEKAQSEAKNLREILWLAVDYMDHDRDCMTMGLEHLGIGECKCGFWDLKQRIEKLKLGE